MLLIYKGFGMKHIFMLSSLTLFMLPCSAATRSYVFNNKTQSELALRWQYTDGTSEAPFVVPAQTSKTFMRSDEKSNLCMSMDMRTLTAQKLPNGNPLHPLVISRHSVSYDELKKNNKISVVEHKKSAIDFERKPLCKDFTSTADAAVKCNPKELPCTDLSFELYETDDNHFVWVIQ